MNISEDFLIAIASIAITLIGFSGVVTALGHRGEGKWSQSEKLQLLTLVEPSLVALFGAFIPIIGGLVIEDQNLLWRTSNGLLLFMHIVGFGSFLKRGRSASVHISQHMMSVVTIAILLFQVFSIFGLTTHHELAFAFSLLLGISVSVINFYLLLFVSNEKGA